MNKKIQSWLSDRWVDFVFGALFGLAICICGNERHGRSLPLGGMLIFSLMFGLATALFGRRIWRLHRSQHGRRGKKGFLD